MSLFYWFYFVVFTCDTLKAGPVAQWLGNTVLNYIISNHRRAATID